MVLQSCGNYPAYASDRRRTSDVRQELLNRLLSGKN